MWRVLMNGRLDDRSFLLGGGEAPRHLDPLIADQLMDLAHMSLAAGRQTEPCAIHKI